MIPDLRARLNAAARKPAETAPKQECLILESSVPLPQMGGFSSVSFEQVFPFADIQMDWRLDRTLFIDTETTGLRGAGTVAFLIGLGWIENGNFVVRQLVMRDYPEEMDMLLTLQDILPGFSCLVSFNGKSFDIPLLRDRFLLSRLPDPWRGFAHVDLLHIARRLWKARLGCCRLEALEETILGHSRENDIPGSQIPERFFRYLKSGDFSLLDGVIRHNRQDILSLAKLLSKLAAVYQAPEQQQSFLDVLSAGRALEKRGLGEAARRCFQVASLSSFSRQARLFLAGSYRRKKDYPPAAGVYFELIDRGEAEVLDYVALAILLEHHLHDFASALRVTEKAIVRFAGDSLRRADEDTRNALYRRRRRLRKKLESEEMNGVLKRYEGAKSADRPRQGQCGRGDEALSGGVCRGDE